MVIKINKIIAMVMIKIIKIMVMVTMGPSSLQAEL